MQISSYLAPSLRDQDRALLLRTDVAVEQLRHIHPEQFHRWVLLNARNYYHWQVPNHIPDHEVAEDLVGEFMLEFAKYVPQLEGNVLPWIRGMLGTLRRRYWSRQKKREEQKQRLEASLSRQAEATRTWNDEDWHNLELFLKELSGASALVRTAIRRRLEEHPAPTYREIAQALGTTEQTVKSRVHEFLKRCRMKYRE